MASASDAPPFICLSLSTLIKPEKGIRAPSTAADAVKIPHKIMTIARLFTCGDDADLFNNFSPMIHNKMMN